MGEFMGDEDLGALTESVLIHRVTLPPCSAFHSAGDYAANVFC